MKTRFLAIVACLPLVSAASAQTTAMTYQGRLRSGGNPASGLHDFRFKLFNAPTGGSQVGQTQCMDNLAVSDGLFVAPIDFGQQFASPNERYLEIEVRANTGLNCSNASGFVVLAPRQLLTAAPLANHARSAFSLDASDGNPKDAVFVDNAGKVGIGTATPTELLHVVGPTAGLILQDSDNSGSGQLAFMAMRNSAGAETALFGFPNPSNFDMFVWNERPGGGLYLGTENQPRAFITPTGNVGIGTTSPLARLDVRGDIRLGSSGQFRAAASEEGIRIIRGQIDTHPFDGCAATPTIVAGSGFSIERSDCGRYRITFTTPFAGVPVVTATGIPVNSCPPVVTASQMSANDVSIQVTCNQSDGIGDSVWPFQFIAVGPR